MFHHEAQQAALCKLVKSPLRVRSSVDVSVLRMTCVWPQTAGSGTLQTTCVLGRRISEYVNEHITYQILQALHTVFDVCVAYNQSECADFVPARLKAVNSTIILFMCACVVCVSELPSLSPVTSSLDLDHSW